MTRDVFWYWHRFRAMSPDELTARARHVLNKRQWKSRGSWIAPAPKLLRPVPWELPAFDQTEAEQSLRGDYRVFDLSFHESPVDWHRDPQTGRRAPREFSLDIDFLDMNVVGNIKYLWEKNRHRHLVGLAAAFNQTGGERFAREVRAQIASWCEQNPVFVGVNWASPLELGLRLISWTWVARLLPDISFWSEFYWHQWIIAHYHSRGSSANNHAIGEMAGLFIASTVWPVFDESRQWQALARAGLEREILRQTFRSGLNREMAFDYHLFTLHLFELASQEADRSGAPFSEAYRARLSRMREVVPALTDAGGNLPRFGDGDDGMAVKFPTLDAKVSGESAPEDAGQFVLALHRRTPHEIFVLADAGPHGFPATAAHAHADALSFTLSVGGKPILVDPGTFDYLAEERNYFRSTRAHNTVVVDDLDQSTMAGPFLWARQARTKVHQRSATSLVASHDGYRPIMHQRAFTLEENLLTIEDSLRGAGAHQATLCFHAAPECEVIGNVIRREGVEVRLGLPEGFEVELAPGWVSPRYGVKQQSVSIFARKRVVLPATFTTKLEVRHG